MTYKYFFVLLALLFSVSAFSQRGGRPQTMISGRVISTEKEVVDFATVYLKGTSYGCSTNEKGLYHIQAPAGEYTLVVTAVGYKTVERKVRLIADDRVKENLVIAPLVTELGEVTVTTSGVSRVNQSAFNAVAIDAKSLHNSTQNLSDALTKVPGIKLRESGGVGSDMNISIDGFTGKHVKLFIDGVPQEGVGSSFGLNNIPINFADRIEVYRGVVPVGFGTDALGGVINIVTNKTPRKWFLDASYSYGSFNTHKSYINFGQTFDNGLTYEINAFQNYSDNSYHIDTYVEQFNEDGTSQTIKDKIEHVKRFNDTYHNEAIIGKVGLVNKPFADRLILGFTYSKSYKEIQNGVIQSIVFGEKHRKGHSLMPSLEYRKRNLFVRGLDVTLTGNYNDNLTQNIDTATYRFNWRGESRYNGGTVGEQSYQMSEFKNINWNGTFTAVYHIGETHSFILNHVLSSLERKSRSDITSNISDYTMPKETRKNITGLSYRYMPSDRWNVSVFGKYYNQFNAGAVSTNSSGVGDYKRSETRVSTMGYGAAGTYFILKDLQVKLSYEKAYRLPTTDELFGDDDLELGAINLKPENSDNLNLNLSYSRAFNKHGIYVEGGLVYRHTKDYIRRMAGDKYSGNTYYASYVNHGKVETKGFNISARYNYSHWVSLGGTFNYMDARNKEKYATVGSTNESMYYDVRLPNQPYTYANSDLTFFWRDFLVKGNVLSMMYDNFYVRTFPLYWENMGASSTKKRVPTQFSHNIGLTYSIKKGQYNFSFECKNLTDEKLYDNFSLQKAGRAFYGKVRVCFGK
ncbi:MAG TPA: TonB-dependent receptor [Bacteroides reticulotermitis]|nr:TonB-dependent receptor [Bacteroides reticulotermitis]